jgi:stearoyl-CoA desaturase (delta-9 desaturase)
MSTVLRNDAPPDKPAKAPAPTAAPEARPMHVGSLPLPEGVEPQTILWPYVIGIGLYHVLSLLALVPWFFSWTGVVVWFIGLYVFGTFGINLCYHRILTHQGLKVPKWLERTLATLGVCCLEDTPARWVAIHRLHHKHSDEQPDPHTPMVTIMWSHMNWLFLKNRDTTVNARMYEKYARDILKDPYYFFLERDNMWVWVNLIQWFVFFLVGSAAGWVLYREWLPAVQFGASMWVWGCIFRTIVVWHITWSVNSLSHMWGYQNYKTGDNSRNNWFVSLIASGEGWHNNHHADQVSAAHGHKWWEADVTWWFIKALEFVGLAKDVVEPKVWKKKQEH